MSGRGRGRGGRGGGRGSRGPNVRGRRAAAAKTIQGAYRNRKQFRRNIQPFVETKAFQSGNVGVTNYLSTTATSPGTGAFNIIVPNCFYEKEQGVADHQMVGDSCYSRYLTTKIRLMFPQGNNVLIYPTSITVFQVWVKAPLAATPFTSPGINNVTQADIELHVKQQCQEFFSTLDDKLEFREKLRGVEVISRRKVRLSRDTSIVQPPFGVMTHGDPGVQHVVAGGTQDWYGTFKWPCKQKLWYEESQSLVGAGITHYLNRPPKNLGYPALIIYNPNFAEQATTDGGQMGTVDRRIAIQYRSKHWFGDQ
jgi:hypothetical protein